MSYIYTNTLITCKESTDETLCSSGCCSKTSGGVTADFTVCAAPGTTCNSTGINNGYLNATPCMNSSAAAPCGTGCCVSTGQFSVQVCSPEAYCKGYNLDSIFVRASPYDVMSFSQMNQGQVGTPTAIALGVTIPLVVIFAFIFFMLFRKNKANQEILSRLGRA
jgi:hypothetical protein